MSIAEFPSVEIFVALSRPWFFERWQLSGCEKSRKWQNLGISFADLAGAEDRTTSHFPISKSIQDPFGSA
jgi:hypothetical protein